MNETENEKRLELLLGRLTDELRIPLQRCEEKSGIREIRLRAGKPVVVITCEGVNFLCSSGRLARLYSQLSLRMTKELLNENFLRLCGYSLHSFSQSINKGYITVEGGHRIGVGGTAVSENGKVTSVRDIECLNIRIAREVRGSADELFNLCFSEGLCSVIIAGPPAGGKTTLLRDLARQLSGWERGIAAKVFACDERGELAASFDGVSSNDLGINCDVITSYPKSEGILIGLRAFSPDVIICDEIAAEDEIEAVEAGVNTGVDFIVSIHARNERELRSKPLIKRLLSSGAFSRVVLLSSGQVGKIEKIYEAGELCGKNDICIADSRRFGILRQADSG